MGKKVIDAIRELKNIIDKLAAYIGEQDREIEELTRKGESLCQSQGEILMAVSRLYYATHWTPDRPVDVKKLWEDVRDACGFDKGNAPKPISMTVELNEEALKDSDWLSTTLTDLESENTKLKQKIEELESDNRHIKNINHSVSVCADHTDDITTFDGCLVCEITRLREALEKISAEYDKFLEAYHTDIIPDIDTKELESSMVSRISGKMGRHLIGVLKRDLEKFTQEALNPNKDEIAQSALDKGENDEDCTK